MERRYKQLSLEREGQDNGDEVGRPEPSGDSEGVKALTKRAIKGDVSQFHASIQGLYLSYRVHRCS
jgi:hypothetical protein